MAVFCREWLARVVRQRRSHATHKPQCRDADDIHEDVTSLTQHSGVQRDEWLGRAKGPKRIRVRLAIQVSDIIKTFLEFSYCAEQEQNDGEEPADATGDRTPEDTLRRVDRGILGLFGNMTRCIEADQNTSGCKI